MAESSTNYAVYFGLASFAAAIVFGAIYFLFTGLYIALAVRRRSFVFVFLVLFCVARTAAFVMRAYLIQSYSAAHDLSIFIAYQIVYNIGFMGVIYSAYSLTINRQLLHQDTLVSLPFFSRITRSKLFFHLTVSGAVALSVVGAIKATSDTSASDVQLGTTLRRVSVYVFLALTAVLVVEVAFLVHAEATSANKELSSRAAITRIGSTHGYYILAMISTLLLIREIFLAATTTTTTSSTLTHGNIPSTQNNEHYWYPLVALTELLAVLLFATPALVPSRQDEVEEEYWMARTGDGPSEKTSILVSSSR